MGTEIERLEIQVEAQKANSQLETLITKLDSVASALMRINGSGLTGMANSVQKIGTVTNSVGLIGETSINTSKALTMLSADLSSLTNQDLSSVMSSLQSGLIGQSRALYKFGIDITNNTLQQYAYAEGIDKSVSAMTQAEKMQLRLLAILDQSKVAWGDQANTLGSVPNQYRIMQQQAGNLARTIGNLFLPVMKVTLPYVNALLIVTQRLLQTFRFKRWGDSWLKDLQDGISGGVIDDSGLEELEEDFDGVADAAKKAKGSVRAFDELNVITTQDKGSASTGGIGGIDLSGSISDALAAYEKTWEEAFAEVENKAQEWADKIEKILEPIKIIFKDFEVDDFFQAGKDVSALVVSITDSFARAIDNVGWYGIGQKIGDFLRGIDWLAILKPVGNSIWQALKAAFDLYVGTSDSAPSETTLISLSAMPGLLKKLTESEIIKGVGNLGSGFSDIATAFKKGGINGALETFRGKLSGIQKFSIGELGVAEEYALVKSGFKDIETGSDNLFTSLGKIAGGAGLAVGALKLIGLSNPWTALVVGATGLAGAIMGINEARKEAFENLVENEELEVFGGKLSDITERLNASAQATKDRMVASMEYVQNAGIGEMQMAKDLADRYFNLYEKENRTNEETEEMQRLAQLLIEKAPELNQYYDEQTGLINGTRDAINDVIDARLREVQLNAISEELTEAYKKRRNALKDVEEAANTAASAQEELSRLQDEYNELTSRIYAETAYEDIGVLLSQGVERLDRATVSQDLLNALTKAGVDETEDLVELYGQLYDIATNFGTEEMPYLPKAAEDLYDMEKLYDEFLVKHKEALDDLAESKSAYDTVENTISDLSQMMSERMRGVGEDFGDGYEEGILSKVKEIEDAAKEIGNAGPNSLRTSIDSHSPSKVTEEIGKDFTEGYNIGIISGEEETKKVVSYYAESIVSAFFAMIESLNQIGVQAMQGLINGLSSMESSVYSKAKDIANNIAKTVKTALEIHSPSRVMFELGDYTMQGFQLGLENVQQTILRSMEDFSYEIVTTPTPSIPELYGNQSYAASYIAKSGDLDFGQSSFGQDSAETNRLLRQILAAVQEGHTITIGRDDVGRASVDFIQENERRLQRSIVGTF